MKYELVFRLHSHVKEHERVDIHNFIDGFVKGLAGAVTRVALNADKVRLVADVAILQSRGVLERVRGHHTVVVIGGGHQDGRILLTVLNGMQWRVFVEILEHLLAVLAGTVIYGPVAANGELVVAQHVHDTHFRDGHGEEVGTLVHDRAHEQTAVGTAHHRKLFLAGVALCNQELSRSNTVVENVLLLQLRTGLVPLLAILATAAKVGHSIHTTLLQPR